MKIIWTYRFVDEDNLNEQEKKQVAIDSFLDYLEGNDLVSLEGNEVVIRMEQ